MKPETKHRGHEASTSENEKQLHSQDQRKSEAIRPHEEGKSAAASSHNSHSKTQKPRPNRRRHDIL